MVAVAFYCDNTSYLFSLFIIFYVYIYYYYFGIIVDIVITGNAIGLYDGSQIEGCCRGN